MKADRPQYKLSHYNKVKYNACDAPGYHRGEMGTNKPKTARIYSVWRIQKGSALCQSLDITGQIHNEVLPLATIMPWTKDKAEASPVLLSA